MLLLLVDKKLFHLPFTFSYITGGFRRSLSNTDFSSNMRSLVLGLVLIFSTSSVLAKGCRYESDCLQGEECCRFSSTCVSVGKCKSCYFDSYCAIGQKCFKQAGRYTGGCVDEADTTTEPPSFTWPDFHVDSPTLPDPDTSVPDPVIETVQPVTSEYCTYDYDCPGSKECSNGLCINKNSDYSYYSSDSDGLGVEYIFLIIIVVIAKVIFWASCLRLRYARRVCRQRMVIVAPPTGPTTTTVNTTTSTIMHPHAAMPPGYAYSNPVVNGGVGASSFPPVAPPPYSSPQLEGQGNVGVPSPMQHVPPPPYSNFHAERQGNASNTGLEQPTESRDNVQLIRPDSS